MASEEVERERWTRQLLSLRFLPSVLQSLEGSPDSLPNIWDIAEDGRFVGREEWRASLTEWSSWRDSNKSV